MRSATVIDVAKEAGVSRTTVSNVFNGKAKYSKETEEAVLAAAKKLGYRPNLAAQALITNRSHLIGLILPSYVDKSTLTNSPFYNIIIDGVYSMLQHALYYDVIIFCLPNTHAHDEVSDWIATRGVDGIIAVGQYEPSFLRELEAKEIPVVFIDSYQHQSPNFWYINSDDEMGGYLATRTLIDSGYREIAICTSASHSPLMQRRLAGYRRAMTEAGYTEYFFEGSSYNAFESGTQLAKALIEQHIDAAFCTEDMLAVGVMQSLLALGVKIGSEFGLVGFDNVPMSCYVFPELTTIDQNITEKGEIATKTLLEILRGDSTRGTRLILPVQVIARGTTRR